MAISYSMFGQRLVDRKLITQLQLDEAGLIVAYPKKVLRISHAPSGSLKLLLGFRVHTRHSLMMSLYWASRFLHVSITRRGVAFVFFENTSRIATASTSM